MRRLPQIVSSPKGLKIREVKALRLLIQVAHIERLARDDVIDVPQVAILPAHPILEQRFEMRLQVRRRATNDVIHLSESHLSGNDLAQAFTEPEKHGKTHIRLCFPLPVGLLPFRLSLLLLDR
jgi:hypothetical protein